MTTIHYTAPFSESRAVLAFRSAISATGLFFAGLWQGFVTYHRFEELKSWRVRHDTALRQAMEQHNRRTSLPGV